MTNRRVITVVGIYKAMFALIQADLQPELEVLIACVLASAEYHGMDFVIATYDHVNGTQ